MTTGYGNILERGSRLKKLLLASAAALTVSAALAIPSWAVVQPGHNISVFHELDIVSASGHNEGDPLTIEVKRNGVTIGRTSGPAVSGPEGVGLEVNHEGTGENDGSCWTGVTPDVLPGDEIVVTNNADPANPVVDSTVVLNVSILEGPFEVAADDPANGLQAGDIVLRGVAADENGNQLAGLAAGVRDRTFGEFRAEPTSLQYIGNTTEWRAIYRAPYNADNRGGLSPEQQRQAILNPSVGHELAWESPDGTVTMVSEGPNPGGPGVGCSAPLGRYAVTSSNPKVINAANVGEGLVVSGSSFDASAVRVEVSDGTNTLTENATPVPESGGQSWTATFAGGAGSLADGDLTARAFYTLAGGEIGGVELQIRKDTAPPQVSDVDLADASDSGASNTDNLTRDNTPTLSGTAEPNSSVEILDGATRIGQVTADASGSWEITVPGDRALSDGAHSVRARATDGAGNSAESANVLSLSVDTRAAVVNASPRGGVYASARSVTLSLANAAQENGTEIYFTLDGSTPQAIAQQLYGGPISIAPPNRTVLKYRALDSAGNLSSTGSQTYRFDTVAPKLASRSPAANATGVGRGANVRAVFSENVTGVSGATFKLRLGTKTVPAVVTYDAATRTAVLNPKASLAAGKKYTVVLTSGIRDSVGNRLSATSWRFTTR